MSTPPAAPAPLKIPSRKGANQGCFQKKEQAEPSTPSREGVSFRGKPLEIEQPGNDAVKEVCLELCLAGLAGLNIEHMDAAHHRL